MAEHKASEFFPPEEEGEVLTFEDEKGDRTELEHLGLLAHEGRSYGLFFPVTEDEPAGSSGEVVVLEVVDFDEEGQPESFELVEDEAIAEEVYQAFRQAAEGYYQFED